MDAPAIVATQELDRLRTRAARFFAVLLWLHVPIVITMAVSAGVNWLSQGLLLIGILSVPTLYAIFRPPSVATRITIALALTTMPILFVYDNPGRLQIEYYFYFFVVFAMLVAFIDWKPIAVAALLTATHHLIFNYIAPSRVFPSGGGIDRVALHVIMVVIECGALVWVVVQIRRLLVNVERAQDAATVHLTAALTDNLTQLGNHRAFSEDLERETARARRHSRQLTLALIDVDDFKSINDKGGHKQGDRVLLLLGQLLRTLRREDRAYRVGGDEFAVLLSETDAIAARAVLERLRKRAQDSLLGATVSIGFVSLDTDLDQKPFELADAALYEAKRRGRNIVISSEQVGQVQTSV